jgi:hypothetical protein
MLASSCNRHTLRRHRLTVAVCVAAILLATALETDGQARKRHYNAPDYPVRYGHRTPETKRAVAPQGTRRGAFLKHRLTQ